MDNTIDKYNSSIKNISNTKIIISSTQYPGYGGAATNAYELIKYFRKLDFNVCGIFFNSDINVNYDPDNINGIYIYDFKNYDKDKVYSNAVSYLKGTPTICFAKNYMAPYLCKEIFNCYTVYLVSGINHFCLPKFSRTTGQDIIKDRVVFNIDIPKEIKCNTMVDLIVLNSKISLNIFNKIYPKFKNKIYSNPIDTSSILLQKNIVKKYDIVICCSRLTRLDKNNMFLINILKNNIFDKYSKIFIGNNYSKFEDIPNSKCLGLLKHSECLKYLSKTKLLLFPSTFDANPNTVREAYSYKCLPLISDNVGNYENYPEELVCRSFDNDEWTTKILYILENYNSIKNLKINFPSNKDELLKLI